MNPAPQARLGEEHRARILGLYSGDPVVVGERGQRHARPAGLRVSLGQHQEQRVVEQMVKRDVGRALRCVAGLGEHQRQIQPAGAQRGDGVRRLCLGEQHVEARVTAAQLGDRTGEQSRAGGGERADPQRTGAELRLVADRPLALLEA